MLCISIAVALLATTVSAEPVKRQANGVNTGVSSSFLGPIHAHIQYAYSQNSISTRGSVLWSCINIQADISKLNISQRCRPSRYSRVTVLPDVRAFLSFAMGKWCRRLGVSVPASKGFCVSTYLDGEGQPDNRRGVRFSLYPLRDVFELLPRYALYIAAGISISLRSCHVTASYQAP